MSERDPDLVRTELRRWLRDRLDAPDLEVTSVEIPQGAGWSTETLFVGTTFTERGLPRSRDLVVRFENLGPALFLEADVRHQWNMIGALAGHPLPPTPDPVGLETDRSRLGGAFSVVERIAGRVAPQQPNYNTAGWIFDLSPGERRRLWRGAIEAMAQLHRIDWRDGFQFLDQPRRGRPGLDQLLRWTEDWYEWARAGCRHPLVEEALARLRAEQPAEAPVSVLWGDAGPNNVLFRDDLSVGAVLDWEAAALGPGEADLAWWMFFDDFMSAGFGIARLEGLPTRDETIAIYEAAAGRPVGDMAYYELLAATRNAVLSMRSVGRQVELGRIPASTTARIHNPPARLLARRLGVDEWEVGEDYQAYLRAVFSAKTAPASKASQPT